MITIKEIENYLKKRNLSFDTKIGDNIEKLRQEAINIRDEEKANYCWCLKTIYDIQKGFVSAINNLKNKNYEDAWCTFERVDIKLGYLENNFDVAKENDEFHMLWIGKMIKEYQKLFPYVHFLSRECIIKLEECSICGKPISLRHSCGHKTGKLYMGELCLRKVTDMELKAVAIVTDPFDKYAYIKLQNQEYDYSMLEILMTEIESPYDEFYVETIKVLKPEYKGVGRNDKCPCGSGKKYKKCHLGTKGELMSHHKVIFSKESLHNKDRFLGYFGTWK